MDKDILVSILDGAVNIVKHLEEAEQMLGQLPYGSIIMHKSKNGEHAYAYHHYNKNRRRMQERLRLSETELEEFRSQLMLHRQYQRERNQGLRYLKQNAGLLQDCYQLAAKNYRNWTARTFRVYQSENSFHAERLIHISAKGERVRSRAEVILANTLAACRIPYRYEKQLTVGNRSYYPDFTVINPLSGKTVYIEYCGMDTPEYEDRLQRKLHAYNTMGITEGTQLMIIREYDSLIDSEKLSKLIKEHFTLKRFDALTHWLDRQICDKIN
jgi:hypothetical protein